MSRSEHVKKNAIYAIINFSLKLILIFVTRKIFIVILGESFLGLNALFTNVFSVLNLAELGIGSAIVFSLYKPIANNDEDKIKSLLKFYKKVYLIIALIVTVCGLIILPLLPYLISKDVSSVVTTEINIYLIYIVLLFNTVISYFFAYRRCALFSFQRNDLETKINSVSLILLYSLEIIVLIITKNYYVYTVCIPIATLVESFLYFKISNKYFKKYYDRNALPLDPLTKQEIKKNTVALMYHKIGAIMIYSTDGIIISAFLGLSILGKYSNYQLIITSVTSMIAVIVNAATSSIGNFIASSNDNEIYKKFKVFNFITIWVAGFCSVALICLLQDFNTLYFGIEYTIDFYIIPLMVINFFLMNSRKMILEFKGCAGLYVQDKYKPIFEMIINLVLDIILIKFLGVAGVVLATTISTLLASFWIEPFVVYKNLFKKKLIKYFMAFITYSIVVAISVIITYFLCDLINFDNKYLNFTIKVIICAIIPNIIYLISYFRTEQFREVVKIVRNQLERRKNRKYT